MARSDLDRNENGFEETPAAALSPAPAPAHLRAQIMARVSCERDQGPAILFRPRFSLPAAAFAISCLFAGYGAGTQIFDASDEVAADMASVMGYIDTGVVTEELL